MKIKADFYEILGRIYTFNHKKVLLWMKDYLPLLL